MKFGKFGNKYFSKKDIELDMDFSPAIQKELSKAAFEQIFSELSLGADIEEGKIYLFWGDKDIYSASLLGLIKEDIELRTDDLVEEAYPDDPSLKRMKKLHHMIGKYINRIEQGAKKS